VQLVKERPLGACALLIALAALILPLQAVAGSDVPYKGRDRGSFVLGTGACAAGFVSLDINGRGKAAHLGRYAYHADECFDGVSAFYGSFTITGANGDTIRATYSGTAAADLTSYTETAVIDGGTGRFEGAEGQLDVSGLITGPTTYSQTMSGVISSPGSSKQ
jgi:hypothetical protein